MAQQCFTGPGFLRLLNSTGSFKVVNTITGTTIGSFNGSHYVGNTSSIKVPGEIYIPSGEHCAIYPDDWDTPNCGCPEVPVLDFVSDLTGGNQQQESVNSVVLPDICANVDGTPTSVIPVISVDPDLNSVVSTLYVDAMGNQITGAIVETDPCDCDCVDCDNTPVPVQQGFDVSNFVGSANTKYNLDDPTASNAYGDVGLDNWTTSDLVDSLNANAASALPPIVPSGIDYSTTVFGISVSNTNAIIVTSGPVPTSISLVSIPANIPLTNI